MMTILIFLQTILLTSLPSLQIHFNNSLSIDAPAISRQREDPPAPSAGQGKVNQQSLKGNKDFRIKTVVIDPGHGGKDPGCLGSNSQEKHIALAIARRLAQEMAGNHPGMRVILTRDEDVFVPLYERAAIANRNDADLFISIHCNYMPNSQATHGTETYVMGLHTAEHNLDVAKRENAVILLEDDYARNYDYDPNSPEGHIILSMYQNAHLEQSILFAERVEGIANQRAQRRSRGVKQAGFVVLKETAMPSVLIETGFLSNLSEERFLKTEEGQQQIAGAIYAAFAEYKAIVEGGAPGQETAKPVATASTTPASPVYEAPAGRMTDDPFQPQAPAAGPNVSQSLPDSSEKPLAVGTRLGTPLPGPPPAATPANNRSTPGSYGSGAPVVTANISSPGNDRASLPKAGTQDAAVTSDTKSAGITFCVQLAASPRPMNTADNRWRDLTYQIEVVEEDNLFKYQARNLPSLSHAMDARFYLRSKGFTDAFIVAYKNGQRIPMEQARRELGE